MAKPKVNDLRIVEISNALKMKTRFDLQQFTPPEKARPDDPDSAPVWVRLATFTALEDARAALTFIRENKAVQTEKVIE